MSASHSVRHNAVALCNLVRSLSSAGASSDAHRKMLDEVDPQALARGITSDYVKLLIFLLGGFSSQVTASLASYNLGSVEGDDGRFLAKVYSLSVKALKVNIKVRPFSYHESSPTPSQISFSFPMPSLAWRMVLSPPHLIAALVPPILSHHRRANPCSFLSRHFSTTARRRQSSKPSTRSLPRSSRAMRASSRQRSTACRPRPGLSPDLCRAPLRGQALPPAWRQPSPVAQQTPRRVTLPTTPGRWLPRGQAP